MSSENKISNTKQLATRPTIFSPQSKVLHHLDTIMEYFEKKKR